MIVKEELTFSFIITQQTDFLKLSYHKTVLFREDLLIDKDYNTLNHHHYLP